MTLELWNRKSLLPTYGLWFDLTARPVAAGPQRARGHHPGDVGPRSGPRSPGSNKLTERATLFQRERLDPGGQARLDWLFTPARRGIVRVELTGVGSLFPFGFLRKSHGTRLRHDAIVWPAPVEYRFIARRRGPASRRRARAWRGPARATTCWPCGATRRATPTGSSTGRRARASAQLMVRQFAAESTEAYFLRIDTPPGTWPREEQFELMCSFAATLAEDLFTGARLAGAAIERRASRSPSAGCGTWSRSSTSWRCWSGSRRTGNGDREPGRCRGGRPGPGGGFRAARPCNVITFAPEGGPGSGRIHRWTKNGHSLASMNCASCAGCSAASWS